MINSAKEKIMSIHKHRFYFLLSLLIPVFTAAQTAPTTAPVSVSLCELLKTPQAYNGKQIQIRGKINLEFEDFSVYDATCNTWPGIWLMFGGDVPTPTKSTVNDNSRPPGKNLKVDGIEFGLIKDQKLKDFSDGILARQDRKTLYRVTATLAGTFLAGPIRKPSSSFPSKPGYGHRGCCYLFIIQQVLVVETKPITDDVKEKWSTLNEPKQ
jgi:hypothetical protein